MTMTARIAVTEIEAGSGTVWVLSALLVLAAVTAGLMAVAAAGLQHARATAAADLAALAAADTLQQQGPVAQACAAAERIARHNGAVLDTCAVSGEVVDVAVTAGWVAVIGGPVRASARAGPVDAFVQD